MRVWKGILLLIVITLTGCETPRVGTPHHVTGSTITDNTPPGTKVHCDSAGAPKELCELAKKNQEELVWYRQHEWPYNRTSTSKQPLVCVSFSGGGIRSAAFSIGVMKGLWNVQTAEGKRLFDQVDILSGTSGGSYALSWYYMQHKHGRNDEDLFVDGGYAQKELLDHAHFVDAFTYAAAGITNIGLLSPANFVLNGILGTHTNTNKPGIWFYQNEIRRTFYSGQYARLIDLQKLLAESKGQLPYFVITTTSRVDENNFHFDSLLRNTVFEFTPLRVGNDGFTYINPDHGSVNDLDIARIVTIAGAALDSSQQVTGSSQRFWASIANADFGQYIYNYNDHRHELRRLITKIAPFPIYFMTESYNHDLRGSDIYLSDGGHQENLAVYPLIRRQCQNIIIVDAEYDPKHEFESYFKLKQSVKREMGVRISLKPLSVCNAGAGAACAGDNVDAIELVQRQAAESGLTRGEAETARDNAARCCFSGRHPVMEGSIRYIPLIEGTDEVKWQEIKLIYVKMSVDTELFNGWETESEGRKQDVRRKIGTKAADYYAATRIDTCEVRYWNSCAFPQYSTIHQSFTPTQFDAYIDLGATMIRSHVRMTGNALSVTP